MGNVLAPGAHNQRDEVVHSTADCPGYTYETAIADLGSLGSLEGTLVDKR